MASDTLGIQVAGISKRYSHRVKGEVYAAREVTLDVQPGEFLTLLGPSGCGKTTTLRVIAGFEAPDAGRVLFGHQDVTGLPANARNIGFVFQNYALFPHLSVFDNVAYGLRVRSAPPAAIRQSVGEVLALVGLTGYEEQFSGQLSGGEQQRVALARAIVIRPRVLLFDEPLSNLDAKLRVQMRQEIRALQRRLGITTVYVTHDQEEAMAVSDRIVVMNQGQVVQQGSAEDLYHRPASDFVARFIGRINSVPATVLETGPAQTRVAALGQTFVLPSPSRPFQAGSPVQLMWRPEAAAVVLADELTGARASAALPSQLQARVLSSTFLGDKLELQLQCQGQTWLAVRSSAGPGTGIAEGDSVCLSLNEAALTLLPLPAEEAAP